MNHEPKEPTERFFRSDKYEDGRTKQSFKEATDINKILARAAKGEAISHLAKHGAAYGDFTDVDDLLTAHQRLERGYAIFNELPGEVRREFQNDLGQFFRYVNDPANVDRLPELIPGLTAPGDQMQDMPIPRRTQDRMSTQPDPDAGASTPPATEGPPAPQAPQAPTQAPQEPSSG